MSEVPLALPIYLSHNNIDQSFLFFGFIVAGEEIEGKFPIEPAPLKCLINRLSLDPFGYDTNDLVCVFVCFSEKGLTHKIGFGPLHTRHHRWG